MLDVCSSAMKNVVQMLVVTLLVSEFYVWQPHTLFQNADRHD